MADKIMMVSRVNFIRKHVTTCGILDLFKHYEYFYGRDYCGDSLWYLKRLLVDFHPEESMPQIFPNVGRKFGNNNYEDCYIALMGMVAHILWHYEDYIGAVIWARKALDMLDYFHPYYNSETKQTVIKENENYSFVAEIFERFKDHFDQELYLECEFDWERKFYSPVTHANQNFKYRIHW